jgi:hypothetical protein
MGHVAAALSVGVTCCRQCEAQQIRTVCMCAGGFDFYELNNNNNK